MPEDQVGLLAETSADSFGLVAIGTDWSVEIALPKSGKQRRINAGGLINLSFEP